MVTKPPNSVYFLKIACTFHKVYFTLRVLFNKVYANDKVYAKKGDFMGRKKIGKEKRVPKTIRIEPSELELILKKFGTMRKMIDAVVGKIKESK